MQPGVLRTLEFDRIVEAVCGFALTPTGEERLARLAPSTDPQKVAQQLAATSEATIYIARNGGLPLRATSDLPQILNILAVEGRPLEATRLLGARGVSRLGRRDADRHSPGRRLVPAARPGEQRGRLVHGRDCADAGEDRSVGRCGRSRKPRAERPFAIASGSSARGCAARSNRICEARKRRNICRTSSSPSATAATCWL